MCPRFSFLFLRSEWVCPRSFFLYVFVGIVQQFRVLGTYYTKGVFCTVRTEVPGTHCTKSVFGTVRTEAYRQYYDTRHFGKYGTASIPVPVTSVSSVQHQYQYLRYRYGRLYQSRYRYRYHIDTDTGHFGTFGTTSTLYRTHR